MEGVFQFVMLMTISYLFVGCAIVTLTVLLLRLLSPNAATRHNIWLVLLVILLLMPLITFLIPTATNEPFAAQSFETLVTVDSTSNDQAQAFKLSQTADQTTRALGVTSTVFSLVSELQTATGKFFLGKSNTATLGGIRLHWLGYLFTFIIAIGIAIKLWTFISSYRKLRDLFATSETVNNDWQAIVARLAGHIGVRNCPMVRQSTEVNTPMASGILNPWIVLPTGLLEIEKSPQFMEQVLLHELAHIKRRDPLVASLQAMVTVFLFWHPAVKYVNEQIRFDRELACDDWVIKHTERGNTAKVKTYANGLLNIAESLQRNTSITHSVACVHTSHGLVNRINILLDRNADHSTSMKRTTGTLVTLMALGLLIALSPLWPQLPIAYAQVPEQGSFPYDQVSDVLIEFAEEPHPVREFGGPLIKSQDLQQATREDSSQLFLEADTAISEIATVNVTADTSIFRKVQELESSKKKLSLKVPNVEYREPNFNSMARLDNIQITTRTNSEITQNTRELQMELSNLLASQTVEPVFTTGQLVLEEIPKSAIEFSTEVREIVVIDDISRAALKEEIRKTEREFYRVFNASIEENYLTIHCGTYRPLGSHFKKHYCEPQFLMDARSEKFRDSSTRFWLDGQLHLGELLISEQSAFEKLTEAMNSVLRESQYFRELNGTLRILRARLKGLT